MTKVVCERWCVKEGVLKMVCDKEVCERWWDKDGVSKTKRRQRRRRRQEEEAGGTDPKTKAPQNDVGKKI